MAYHRSGVKKEKRQPVHESQHGADARLQIGQSLFGVFQFGPRDAGQARLQQCVGIDIFATACASALLKTCFESPAFFEDGNGGGVKGVGHGFFH